jgi:nucleotide-binding universal stress UspA family protein
MTPKSILVLVDGGPQSEATLATGLAVAKSFGAQVQALHVQADPATLVPIVGEGMSGAMVEQVMDAMAKAVDQRAQKARAAYDKLSAAGSGVALTWRQEMGPEPVVLAAAGRLVDLTVLGRPDKSMDGQTAASLDAALFDTGRPVLVAPPAVATSFGRRVALAWNGSAEASRVVACALPYLVQAEHVTVLSAPGTDKRAPAEALIAYLALHGVKADAQSFELHHHQSVGHGLLEQAEKMSADLLAMGAYGHSRLREMILGGATRDVLAQATLPVLMAH